MGFPVFLTSTEGGFNSRLNSINCFIKNTALITLNLEVILPSFELKPCRILIVLRKSWLSPI